MSRPPCLPCVSRAGALIASRSASVLPSQIVVLGETLSTPGGEPVRRAWLLALDPVGKQRWETTLAPDDDRDEVDPRRSHRAATGDESTDRGARPLPALCQNLGQGGVHSPSTQLPWSNMNFAERHFCNGASLCNGRFSIGVGGTVLAVGRTQVPLKGAHAQGLVRLIPEGLPQCQPVNMTGRCC